MFEAIIWIFFFYALYRFLRTTIQGAVQRGIKDYEKQKDKQRRNEKEVRIDRRKVEDAKYEDLK